MKVPIRLHPLLFVAAAGFLTSCTPTDWQTGDLFKEARASFRPLPSNFFAPGDPPSQAMIDLGQRLFFDGSVSIDGKISCATCHPVAGHGADGLPQSIGNNGRINPRNAPTVFNAAGHFSQHWRGDRVDVEDQALLALTGKASFGAPDHAFVERKLKSSELYVREFALAFPDQKNPVTAQHYAEAIGAYERTLVSPSRFDDFLKGKEDALNDEEKKGLSVFMKTGCIGCHNGPFAGGNGFQKFGVMRPYNTVLYANRPAPQTIDHGRKDITGEDRDLDLFKVPSLRNVEKTSPYFHDGSVSDLGEAVRIMAELQLGKRLEEQEVQLIVRFLKSLTGSVPENFKKRE